MAVSRKYVINGYRIEEDPDENRIRINDTRALTKEQRWPLKTRGFRFSRDWDAWQRHLNSAGRAAVRMTCEALPPGPEQPL